MRLAIGYDREVAHWVGAMLPHVGSGEAFGECVAIGVVDDHDLIAGVVFNNYIDRFRSIELSMASVTPRWVTRSILAGILAYPYDQMGCIRVTTITPRKNKRALTFNRKLGFKQEGIIRRGFGSQDAVICGLLAKEWRQSPFNQNRVRLAEAA